MSTSAYEIGGVHVEMTPYQADRWNSGQTSQSDLRNVIVYVPKPGNQYRQMTLRRALSRLEPDVCSMLLGMPANPLA